MGFLDIFRRRQTGYKRTRNMQVNFLFQCSRCFKERGVDWEIPLVDDDKHVYMQLIGQSPDPFLESLPVVDMTIDEQGKYHVEDSFVNLSDGEAEPVSGDGLREGNLVIKCDYCSEEAHFALAVGIIRNREGSVLVQEDGEVPEVYCAPIVLLRDDKQGDFDLVAFLNPISETKKGPEIADPEMDDDQAVNRLADEEPTVSESVAEMIAKNSAAIREDPNDEEAHYNRALAYVLEEDYDSALEDLSRAIALNPEYIEAITKRGIMYGARQEFDVAMKDFKRAIDLNHAYAPAYLNRGICHYEMNNTDLALEDLARVLEISTEPVLIEQARQCSVLCRRTNGLSQCGKGIASIYEGQLDRAIRQLTKVMKSNPENAAAYFYLGMAYDNKEDYDSSVAALNTAIELDPEFPCAHNNRGWVYLKTAHYTQAIADFTKEIELSPDLVPAYVNRANAYHNITQYRLAVADLKTALDLSTDPEEKAKIQHQIQAIRRA